MPSSIRQLSTFALTVGFLLPSGYSQTPAMSSAKSFSGLQWQQDSDVKCLRYAVEAGDPDKGPSTHALSFPNGCSFPWHYHTAEEQLEVVRGLVSVQMGKEAPLVLGVGGFALMPSKELHRFSCASSRGRIAFVHFDRAYDIFWEQKP